MTLSIVTVVTIYLLIAAGAFAGQVDRPGTPLTGGKFASAAVWPFTLSLLVFHKLSKEYWRDYLREGALLQKCELMKKWGD